MPFGELELQRRIHGSGGDVHIPVGGSRFRPCLEDVLEMLIKEFGIDHADHGWRTALAEGRARWRKYQLMAAITDDPSTAVAKLRELGHSVEWKEENPEPTTNVGKLERF